MTKRILIILSAIFIYIPFWGCWPLLINPNNKFIQAAPDICSMYLGSFVWGLFLAFPGTLVAAFLYYAFKALVHWFKTGEELPND